MITSAFRPGLARPEAADLQQHAAGKPIPDVVPPPPPTALAVATLEIAGAKALDYHPNVAAAVSSGSISYGTDVTSQVQLTLEDPGYEIAGSGLFTAPDYSSLTSAGSTMAYAGQPLECRVIELTGSVQEQMIISGRSAGISVLSRQAGPAEVLRDLSPAQYVALKAKQASMDAVIQPGGLAAVSRPTITRAMPTAATATAAAQAGESSWDVITRLGTEVGFLAFEVQGTLYFAQPTWLVEHMPRHSFAWLADGEKRDPGIMGFSDCRRSGDDATNAATVDVTLHPEIAQDWLPGHAVDVYGVPHFEGRYLITGWSWDLDLTTTVTVNLATPVNPVPQPPVSDTDTAAGGGTPALSGSLNAPPAGTYGGTPLDADQCGNAEIIASVGQGISGIGSRGVEIAIMTALQESTLRNLSGGNRDSVGLFQQRPGQGWGTVTQCETPTYAANSFYQALLKVGNWQSLALTDAAQAVQRSAYPSAYAKWQPVAAALIAAMAPASGGGTTVASGSGAFTDGNVALIDRNPNTLAQAQQFALQQAREHHTSGPWGGLCASFVESCWDSTTGYGTRYAIDLFGLRAPSEKGTDRNPPVGACLIWDMHDRAGHVTFYMGAGQAASSDILYNNGEIGISDARDPETKWHGRYVGWCQPIFSASSSNTGLPGQPRA